jgi:hypothetical protein
MTIGALVLSVVDMSTLSPGLAVECALVAEAKESERPAKITERRIEPSFDLKASLFYICGRCKTGIKFL